MRHAGVRFVGAVAALVSAAACAASGSEDETHGPSYPLDGGADVTAASADAGTSDATTTAVDSAPQAADASSRIDAVADTSTAPVDAADAALPDGSSCTATTAIIGGGSSSAFGAVAVGTGSLALHALTGAVLAPPAVASFGSGFQALYASTNNALEATSYASSWATPSAVGAALLLGSPALATVGSSLHAVYLGTDYKYYHATYAGSSWDSASDKVAPGGDAGAQSFGPCAAAAAPTTGGFTIANAGSSTPHVLYDQAWSTTSGWASGSAHAGTSLNAIAPAMVALTGGTSDLLVVYVDTTGTLQATSRATGTWSAPTPLSVASATADPPALAAMSGGRAVLVYRGGDAHPYYATFDPARATPWSTPAALVTPSPTIVSAPSVAAGVCGDDAVAAYVDGSGAVSTVGLSGGTWQPRGSVAAGATYATVATRP
jgi:hypothetical protein